MMRQVFRNVLIGLAIWNHVYPQSVGIIGGYNNITGTSYAALIDASSGVQLLSNLPSGPINSVSMNASGDSGIGGQINGVGTYFSLVDPSGFVQPKTPVPGTQVFSLQINSSGNFILGGGSGTYFGARADPSGNITSLSGFPGGGGTVVSAAINDSGLAIVGGGSNSYAGLIQPNSLSVVNLGAPTGINSVAVNASGTSIIVGNNYVNRFDALGTSIGGVGVGGAVISKVAINDAGTALIGGTNGAAAYASLIDSSGTLHPLSGDPLPAMGAILGVDINNDIGCGNAIIGGYYTAGGAYAAYVDATGVVHNIVGLPSGTGATISSVSINQLGIALIGGTTDGTNSYAALVTPWNGLSPLSVNTAQPIASVSIRNFVPTNHLTGNNLSFATYIGQYASEKAIYFCPSLLTKTFQEALESVAPTRNAFSLFSVANNLFFLNHSLSDHLRNHHHFQEKAAISNLVAQNLKQEQAFFAGWLWSKKQNVVLANADIEEEPLESPMADPTQVETSPQKHREYTIWFEALGAWVSQKAEHQTVGFNPSVGGFILGLERCTSWNGQLGGGAAYTFTHIHEKNNAGYSRIQQEYLFLYGTWSDEPWYVDASMWTGIFQTHQVRFIHMTGFDFISSSNPAGFQLSPHLEIGYEKHKYIETESSSKFIINPFGMCDWANVWQDKYEERGNGPFNAGQKAGYGSLLRAEAGIRLYETAAFDSCFVTFEEKGSYVYIHPFEIGTVNAYLVGSPGSFTVETLTSPASLGVAELSLILEPANHAYPYGSISYQGEFGSKYQSHQANLEISWDF